MTNEDLYELEVRHAETVKRLGMEEAKGLPDDQKARLHLSIESIGAGSREEFAARVDAMLPEERDEYGARLRAGITRLETYGLGRAPGDEVADPEVIRSRIAELVDGQVKGLRL